MLCQRLGPNYPESYRFNPDSWWEYENDLRNLVGECIRMTYY